MKGFIYHESFYSFRHYKFQLLMTNQYEKRRTRDQEFIIRLHSSV